MSKLERQQMRNSLSRYNFELLDRYGVLIRFDGDRDIENKLNQIAYSLQEFYKIVGDEWIYIFKKYKIKIVHISNKENVFGILGSYNPILQTIYINFTKYSNYSLESKVLFHEIGHFIDYTLIDDRVVLNKVENSFIKNFNKKNKRYKHYIKRVEQFAESFSMFCTFKFFHHENTESYTDKEIFDSYFYRKHQKHKYKRMKFKPFIETIYPEIEKILSNINHQCLSESHSEKF